MSPVSVKDIADRAGVTNMTVSMALRDHPRISIKRRKQIQKLAAEMGYAPNLLSKALREGKTKTIGILLTTLTTHVVIERTAVIEAAARKAGYCCFISGIEADDDDAICRAAEQLIGRQVDGLIVTMSQARPLPDRLVAMIDRCPAPAVYMGWAPAGCATRVNMAFDSAIETLAEHLAQLGHRRVAMIESPWMRAHPTHRRTGTAAALARHGISLDDSDDWAFIDDPPRAREDVVYDRVLDNLKRGLRPDVLFASDQVAAAAMVAAQDFGLTVPDDLSIVGFDDLPLSRLMRPAITTIHAHNQHAAQAAADMLLNLMNQRENAVQPVVVNADLVVRQSTGPAPKRKR